MILNLISSCIIRWLMMILKRCRHITLGTNIRVKIFILCIIFLGLLTRAACSQNKVETNVKSENSIVFNGWYHIGKEKWRGPFNNKLLFTWFTARTSAANNQEYKRLIDRQRKEGVKFIGYYYSATTSRSLEVKGHPSRFPERRIPPEAIESSWVLRDSKGQAVTWHNDKNRYYLDVGMKQVQDAILTRAIRNAKELGANVLFLDNWAYKYWAPGGLDKKQWTEKCLSFLVRARELTTATNLKLVVNLSTFVELFPEFAAYLDGISYEMGAHPYRLKTKGRYEEELKSYDKVMAMGKSIFLWTDMLKDNGERWDEDGRKVAATAMLVMPKDQPYWGGIYVANPRYEPWPVGGWAMWSEQLGKPLGPREWNGNTVVRKFERGSISVTVGQSPKFTVSLEY
jgi:hypothetical protein